MNMDQFLNEIVERLESIMGLKNMQNAILYGEIERGYIASFIFFEDANGVVIHRLTPDSIINFIYDFWENWCIDRHKREWRLFTVLLDRGKGSIDLEYPEDVDPDEDISERQPLMVRKHFGERKVDYSQARLWDKM